MKVFQIFLFGVSLALGALLRADIPTNGLIAHFPMDEGSGNTIRDTVSGTDATFGGGGSPDWTTFGGRLNFQQSNEQFLVTDDATIGDGISGRFTLAARIRPLRTDQNWLGIITKQDVNSVSYSFFMRSGGRIGLQVSDGIPETFFLESSPLLDTTIDPQNPREYHVAVTSDGSTVRFYVNGELDPVEHTASLVTNAVNEPLVIGAAFRESAESFDGMISDVVIYDRALSNFEMVGLAGDLFGGPGVNDGLLAYFPMDEGSGNTIREVLSSDTATLTGDSLTEDWTTYGGIFNFDQSNNQRFVTASNEIGDGITDEFTITARIRPENVGENWLGIVTKGTTASAYSFLMRAGGRIGLLINGNRSGFAFWESSPLLDTAVDPNDPREYNVAVSYDGANLRFFVNGVQDPVEHNTSFTISPLAEPIVIGADLPGQIESFDGAISEVAIYDQALSRSEIKLLTGDLPSNGVGSADIHTGLIAYFPMDEGSGNTVEDVVSGTNATFAGNGSIDWTTLNGRPFFDASQFQRFESDEVTIGDGITNEITISARIRPADLATPFQGIVTKGITSSPYSLSLAEDGRFQFVPNWLQPPGSSGPNSTPEFSSALAMDTADTQSPPREYHIAITYDGSTIRHYLDGVKDPFETDEAIGFGSIGESLVIGAGLPSDDEYFHGGIYDVAIYNRALPAAAIGRLASGAQPRPNPLAKLGFRGLWVGEAVLDEVKEVATDTWGDTPAPFRERIILHVDDNLYARILPVATIMQTRGNDPEPVIISDPSLIPSFDGITPRGGELVGQRFTSATLPTRATSLPLTPGEASSVTFFLSIPPEDPLNPYRHKFHPDLGNGFALTRTLSFTVPNDDSPADNELVAPFTTQVTGLHKDQLDARGTITFTRVSSSGVLNPAVD